MKFLKTHIIKLCFLSSAVSLTSCALKSIPSEYSTVKIDNVDTGNLGNGKILIYNGAGFLHAVDNTARLNIWINNKSLGQIRPKEYLVIDLPKGKYEFTALHIDMVNMRSKHQVEVDENTKVINIEPTITSNRLTVTNVLPKNFDKYVYRPERN
ncbi:hypothetical protein DRF59_11005 [Chryseobacterium flavum]|uniref:DUF2846 domain-containing protein n=1 Tax=Chryseobacterium flavum TaxID=415851 RepID=A0A3D9CM53_9FLAO|nr:hypothetical protein [Chryseobacterium flavum]REC66831.1 hypothetical protein DRF59_11005 [Chryseobacterium flavum]